MNEASAFDIASSGMAAHRLEMDVIAANLANADTASANGVPYRMQTAVFEPAAGPENGSTFSDALDLAGALSVGLDDDDGADPFALPAGVRFAGVEESEAPAQYRYDPGNPAALNSGPHRGFVALSNVDPIEQMVSLVAAGRAYDADVAALQAAKQMDVEAIDVDRS